MAKLKTISLESFMKIDAIADELQPLKKRRPSVRASVRPSVRPSVRDICSLCYSVIRFSLKTFILQLHRGAVAQSVGALPVKPGLGGSNPGSIVFSCSFFPITWAKNIWLSSPNWVPGRLFDSSSNSMTVHQLSWNLKYINIKTKIRSITS